MMRAWENRSDCVVLDEPFYGYYLQQTGIDHPGAADVIQAQGSDWQAAVDRCLVSPAACQTVFYQKHMTLHLLDEVPRGWLSKLHNCFLIREPEAVISSYAAVRADVQASDIGFQQQVALYDFVAEMTGEAPLVIDSKAFLEQPEAHLRAWCAHLGIAFEQAMLSWPAGARDTDGVWARHWYDAVYQSIAFSRPAAAGVFLDTGQQALADAMRPHYEYLFKRRLVPAE
jgi:hypothetical protein